METFTATVQEDKETGDLYIELPQSLLSDLQWDENTKLNMKIEDNRITIQKKNKI